MRFNYRSGEEIMVGDRVKLHGRVGRVEFIVRGYTGDAAMDWYVEQFDGGVMVNDEQVGKVFLSAENIDEDEGLLFLGRDSQVAG